MLRTLKVFFAFYAPTTLFSTLLRALRFFQFMPGSSGEFLPLQLIFSSSLPQSDFTRTERPHHPPHTHEEENPSSYQTVCLAPHPHLSVECASIDPWMQLLFSSPPSPWCIDPISLRRQTAAPSPLLCCTAMCDCQALQNSAGL